MPVHTEVHKGTVDHIKKYIEHLSVTFQSQPVLNYSACLELEAVC